MANVWLECLPPSTNVCADLKNLYWYLTPLDEYIITCFTFPPEYNVYPQVNMSKNIPSCSPPLKSRSQSPCEGSQSLRWRGSYFLTGLVSCYSLLLCLLMFEPARHRGPVLDSSSLRYLHGSLFRLNWLWLWCHLLNEAYYDSSILKQTAAFWHFWWSLCCSNLFFHEFVSWLTYCVLCSYIMCIFLIAAISSTQNVSPMMRSEIFVLFTDVSQGTETESSNIIHG